MPLLTDFKVWKILESQLSPVEGGEKGTILYKVFTEQTYLVGDPQSAITFTKSKMFVCVNLRILNKSTGLFLQGRSISQTKTVNS